MNPESPNLIFNNLDFIFPIGLFFVIALGLAVWAVHRKNEESRVSRMVWKATVVLCDSYVLATALYFSLRFVVLRGVMH